MRAAWRLGSIGALLMSVGCGGQEPVYDDALGVTAIPVEEGALAGTFALKTLSLNIEDTPVGEAEGGGTNLRLVRRSYDEASGTYLQRSLLCGGRNFEVAGATQTIPEASYRKVPESTQEVTIADETGVYTSTGHLQLWGIRDLPDPYNTPLPKDIAEASVPPNNTRVYDMDEDGNPGVTIQFSGVLIGDAYGIQRRQMDLRGVTLGPDHIIGLSALTKESVRLGASNRLLLGGTPSFRPHPDPLESWFDEVRIDEGADCDDVMALDADGTLAQLRPF